VDFERSEDQEALAEGVRALVAGEFPLDRIRRLEGARLVVERAGWAALGEAGVFSLALPEQAGGAGLGLADAAVVFGELGRALVPGPLVASHLAALLPSDPVLDGAADGRVVVGMLRRPPHLGTPVLVEHLGSLDALVVRSEGAPLAVLAARDLEGTLVEHPLDPLTPMEHLRALPGGQAIGDLMDATLFERRARVLTGALLAGSAAATCAMAVEYAKARRQFDRPIGSFQAVKHLCADMLVRAELARAAVDAAAVTLDDPDVGDAERAAATAAFVAADAATRNAKSCLQVHGGMGFTWEVPVHLHLMRARVLTSSLGPSDEIARIVAARY